MTADATALHLLDGEILAVAPDALRLIIGLTLGLGGAAVLAVGQRVRGVRCGSTRPRPKRS